MAGRMQGMQLMTQPLEPRSLEEARVDDAAAASFPASDAPSWTATHLGAPSQPPLPLERVNEVRATLRADIERLSRRQGSLGGPVSTEDVIASTLLEAGRSVVREPVDGEHRNIEVEQIGALPEAPCVVISARYDASDVSGAAMLLALARALDRTRTQRTVRLVAFCTDAGSIRYVDRLREKWARVHAMVSLARLDLTQRGERLLLVSNLRSLALARSAREAFRGSSRIPLRLLPLPSIAGWLGGVGSADAAAFWRREWRAMALGDEASPWSG